MRARRVRRAVRRAKDLVWITTIVEASVAETALDIAQVLVSADWSGGNVGFDRCTLMAVRGWIGMAQIAASTANEATGLWLALYVTDGSLALNNMDPQVATEYVQFDTLWTDGLAISTSSTSAAMKATQLDIKARRKLTTASEVRLAASMPTDTATPRVNVVGCVRALVRLDPP